MVLPLTVASPVHWLEPVFLIIDFVVGGIGSTIPPDIDLVVCRGGDSGESNRSGSCLLVCGKGCGWS